jgi:hypothetical protein
MTAATDVVRQVGISHRNNVRSLIDHAHCADSLHYVLDTLRREMHSFLWDLNYFLEQPERTQLLALFDNVQQVTADKHFRETVDNYHSHHFEINHETQSKGLRSWAMDALAITQMYKQLVTECQRSDQLTDDDVRQLVDNFISEMQAHDKTFEAFFAKSRARNASYDPLTTPILSDTLDDRQATRATPPFRPNPTWLSERGDRPGQTLKPAWMDLTEPKPPGGLSSFQGGRNLYESQFNDRKAQLAQPKYNYKVEAIQAENQRKKAETAERLLAIPSRR